MDILIVDDQRSNLSLMTLFVKLIDGCEAHPFLDPMAALDAAAKRGFDLAIIDYKMPEMDGPEVIRRLRALPGGPELPVIVTTTLDEKVHVLAALREGIAEFLTKPIDRRSFTATVERLLSPRLAAAS